MNITNVHERPDPEAPELFISPDELRRIRLADSSPPFQVGEKVKAKLLPVDAERGIKQQVTTAEPLTVSKLWRMSRGGSYRVMLVGYKGAYDACFFRK